ncbi:MAG: hypothetical protein WCQ99_13405 [Pseudomonadota bacterium]
MSTITVEQADCVAWDQNYWHYKWQSIRRHPDYKSFCEQFPEDDWIGIKDTIPDKYKNNLPDGFVLVENLKELHGQLNKEKAVLSVKKKFGLKRIFHCSCDIPMDVCRDGEIFEDIGAVTRLLSIDQKEKKTVTYSAVDQLKYIDLRINISPEKNKKQILAEVEMIINFAKTIRAFDFEDKEKKFNKIPQSRFHYNNVFKIWDLRCLKKSFSDIALEVERHDTKKAIEKVRKQFYRAYELIYGKPYDKGTFSKDRITKRVGINICKDCPTWANCSSLCPEALAYADQDKVTLREKLSGDRENKGNPNENAVEKRKYEDDLTENIDNNIEIADTWVED